MATERGEQFRERLQTAFGLIRFYATKPGRYREAAHALTQRGRSPLQRREPWWPTVAIAEVRAHLPREAEVFEFGGGGSTLWLTDLGARVTVVEHVPAWSAALASELPSTARIITVEPTTNGSVSSAVEEGFFDAYIGAIDVLDDETLDLVVVDGRARKECALRALRKIRPGGMLILDDAERERYAGVATALQDWARSDHRGAKAGGAIASTTTWIKPTPPD